MGARGAQGRAVRRPASQEHLRVGNAGHRRRAPLRRTSATSACSPTRSTASCCGTTRFDPQPMYLDFGTASSPVVHDGRVFVLHDNDGKSFARGGRREDRQAAVEGRSRSAGGRADAPGWSTPFVWKHAQRTEIVVIGRAHAVSLRARQRQGAVAAAAGSPASRRRARSRPTACSISPPDRRARATARCLRCVPAPAATSRWPKGEEQNAVRRVVPPARVRLHLVAARLSRPHVRGERQRHPHGVRRADRQGDLQGARRRLGQHVLGVAAGPRTGRSTC